MTIQRRFFNAGLAGLAGIAAVGAPGLGQAQSDKPVEGKHFLRLAQPLASAGAEGKIEVFEFFLYTCPHCFAFDPALSAWSKTLAPDVSLRRIHVGVGAMHKLHQRLFYALESLGRLGDLHEQVFKALQIEKLDLSSEKAITAWAVGKGLDGAKFGAAFNSFGAQTRLGQSTKLAEAYRADGVPALGVAGRFLTSPSMAGGIPQALVVADHLIKLARSKS
ncbi:thiol:disulfide interchange protein DsbA/DsbL [Paucibacter sp. TC2R-5]|uniref:thiol:disulfide interchange protein DsbA/DsbL n=1 Tax=Paucibacter sp. TC2R-5 TaxID=2893555 RepID=UPI0021E3FF0D|nr:thiol:disulfide interchange protein DsbA/DsbL [Paucibacter sp. TC2R-5]MCV2360691.1 thiol:disulfide interchange protein DsbA/DsbL [Paucibacter sp. TC2R-5]